MSIKKTWSDAGPAKKAVMTLGAFAVLILVVALIVGCGPKPFVGTQSDQAERDFRAALVAKGYPSNIAVTWDVDDKHYEATIRVRTCDVELDQTGAKTFTVDALSDEDVTKKKLGQSPSNISLTDLNSRLGKDPAKKKFRCV